MTPYGLLCRVAACLPAIFVIGVLVIPPAARAGELAPLLPWQEESALAALHDPSAAVQQAALAWLSDKQLASEPLVDAVAAYLRAGQPPEARQHAAKTLENRQAKAARFAPQLVGMLWETDPEIRGAAAHALNAMVAATAPVARQLGERLKDQNARSRFYAVALLGNVPSEAAPFIQQIAALVDDKDMDVRLAAINTLGAIGPAGAAHASQIVHHLGDSGYIRDAALKALCRMGPEARSFVPGFIALLKQPHAGTRRVTAEVLGGLVCLGSTVTDAAPQIAPLLADPDPDVRGAAASALLGNMPSQAAPFAARFLPLLTDADSGVRQFVSRGLSKLGPAAAALSPQLVPLLKDKSPEIRDSAIAALGSLGPGARAAVPMAARLLEDRASDVRVAALKALGSAGYGDRMLGPQVARLLKDPVADVRVAAVEALGKIGPAAAGTVPQLVHLLPDINLQAAVVRTLGAIEPADALVPQLMALILPDTNSSTNMTESAFVSVEAAQALGKLGAAALPALPQLVAALEDRRHRLSAVNALGALGPLAAAAAPQAAALLKNHDDPYGYVHQAAVDALGKMGPAAASVATDIEALLETDTSPDLKSKTVTALGLMGPAAARAAPQLLPLLKEPEPQLRLAVLQSLDKMNARAVAAGLAPFLADPDSNFRKKLLDLLDRWVAQGPLQDRGILLQCLAAAHAVHPAAGDLLLRAYVYRRNEPRDLLLIRWLGDRGAGSRPQSGSLDTESSRALLAGLAETWEDTRSLPGLHLEAAERIAELARGREWQPSDVEKLDELQKRMAPEQPAQALAVRTVVEGRRWQDRLRESGGVIAAHIAAWIALIFLYPRVRWVQSFFFWNKWARRFLGAGYVGVLIMAVPWLRRRMFLPFKESLLPRMLLEQLSEATYFTGSEVLLEKNRRTQPQRLPLGETLPAIRGQAVIKGQSGLGKTLLLLRLAVNTKEPVVLLRATECSQGVLAAIQKKLHGQLKDAGYLQALIHAGGLKILIDGLNEALPEARVRITQFVEEYFRGDFILTTQPIEWEPPATARLYVLQPLLPQQIGPFLLQQWEGVRSRATLNQAQYAAAVGAYVESLRSSGPVDAKVRALVNSMQAALAAKQLTHEQTPDDARLHRRGHRALSGEVLPQEQADPRLISLSNLMDATLAAELLARGETPDAFRLVEQRYQVMSAEFREREGRDFRLQAFAEAVYGWRNSGQPDFREPGFEAEVAALVRERLMLERTEVLISEKGEDEVTRRFFRHDKIMEFFLLPAFIDNPQRREAHTQDEPFWGVYELLALRLAPTEERQLQQLLLDQAADTRHYELLNRYTLARLLAADRTYALAATAPLTL